MKHLDKASPKLYEFCCNGKHVKVSPWKSAARAATS